MTQQPVAGWYPDPDPAFSNRPGRLRYWDGSAWTEHIHEPPVAATPPPFPADAGMPQSAGESGDFRTGTPAPQPTADPYAAAGYPAYPGYAGQPGGSWTPQPAGPQTTTPDGVPLASWGRRVAATIIDGLILFPLLIGGFVVALLPIFEKLDENEIEQLADGTYTYSSSTALTDGEALALFAALGAIFVVPLLYQFIFLVWKQATPGKLALGLRVRKRLSPTLPVGTVVGRMAISIGVSFVPFGTILDYLWPLWDDRKQALHDKLVDTNVVRVR